MKCDTYWPLEPLECVEFGKFKILNLGIASKGDYQITLLEVTNSEVQAYTGHSLCAGLATAVRIAVLQTGETRRLKHFLFLSWPDYGVPPDANGFLKFLFHVRKAQHHFTESISWKVGTTSGL